MLAWSGEYELEKSHFTLTLKVRWCDHVWFLKHTAKNLVAYATSWSLTLSPGELLCSGTSVGRIFASICSCSEARDDGVEGWTSPEHANKSTKEPSGLLA